MALAESRGGRERACRGELEFPRRRRRGRGAGGALRDGKTRLGFSASRPCLRLFSLGEPAGEFGRPVFKEANLAGNAARLL